MIKTIMILFVAILSSAEAYSGAMPPKELLFEELAQKAVEKSPTVKVFEKEYQIRAGGVFGALLPNDPEFGVDAEAQPGFLEIEERQNLEYSLTQSIPFPTKLISRSIAASQDAKIAYQRWKSAEREAVRNAARFYQELVVMDKTTALLGSNLKILESVLNSVSSRYETNPTAQEDVLKTRIELDETGIEMFTLTGKRRPLEARIARLLGDPMAQAYVAKPKGIEKVSFFSVEALQEKAAVARHELKMFKSTVDKTKTERALGYQEILPDITLRYEGRTSGPSGGIEEHDTFIGLTVPAWSLLKGLGGNWRSNEANVAAAEVSYENIKQEIFIEIQEAYAAWRSAENALRVYESSILPQANQQLELARSSYESGRRDFLGVMDAIRTYREAHTAYFKAQADYEIAVSELRFASGGSL